MIRRSGGTIPSSPPLIGGIILQRICGNKSDLSFFFTLYMNLFHFSTLILHNPAIHCQISPNFTLFLPSIAGIQVFASSGAWSASPPPTGLKRCSLCRMREIPPRRIGDSCSERISGLAIRRVTRYNKEHLVFLRFNNRANTESCTKVTLGCQSGKFISGNTKRFL